MLWEVRKRTGSTAAKAAISAFLAAVLLCPPTAAAETPDEMALRRHMLSFFQRGSRPEEIPESHPLYPITRVPVIATTSYMLLGHDPSLLIQFYEQVYGMVIDKLNSSRITPDGLFEGTPYASDDPLVTMSPALNSLVNLELYSLHLIAGRAGRYDDALELLFWSRRFAGEVTRRFYEPAKDCFFPLDENGRPLDRYSPEQLLPLLLDTELGRTTHGRVVGKFLSRRKSFSNITGGPLRHGGFWKDPIARPIISACLASIPDPHGSHKGEIRAMLSEEADAEAASNAYEVWERYWEGADVGPRLLPPAASASALVNLVLLLEKESLMEEEKSAALRENADSLLRSISTGEYSGRERHAAAVGTVNGLLSTISKLSAAIASERERWRMIDEHRWNLLSPRVRRLIGEACPQAIEDLKRAKVVLSERLSRETGLTASIRLPEQPVPVGRPVDYSASLTSGSDSLIVKNIFLQIGENRWRITQPGERIALGPGAPPFTFTGTIPISPSSEPGIVTLPVFFDFMAGDTRIEIHQVRNISLSRGCDVSLTYPEGKRLTGGTLPLDIILKHAAEHDVQGTVDGTFMPDLVSRPSLPARFLVQASRPITKLPIAVYPRTSLSPGRYPFALTVELAGRPIAYFEDELYKPIRWFYMGPFSQYDMVMKNGVEYQDDLLKAYATAEGNELRWREIPAGATDPAGGVLPGRLFANPSKRCLLLYTVIQAQKRAGLVWRLETKNMASLWINGEPALPYEDFAGGEITGAVELRKGLNTFLIASCWERHPDRLLFELSEENRLPAPGISNEIERIVDGFDMLAALDGAAGERDAGSRLSEVRLTLDYPNASEVCVTGSFNNWEPSATPMKREEAGTWKVIILLHPGRYPYNFLINRKTRITDPENPLTEPDGFGGHNSILVVP